MEAPANAPLVGIAVDFLEHLFFRHASFSWSDSGRAAMSLWLGSGERSASSTGGSVGSPLGLNVAERRRVFAISEDGDGSENSSLEESDVIPYTVLSMRRLSGASAVAQFGADIPLQLIEGIGSKRIKQQVWEKKRSNDGNERKFANLMEDDSGTEMIFLQSKALCKMPIIPLATITYSHIQSSNLKAPDPNAPL